MSLSAYLWGIRLFVLLSLAAWLGIVFAIDPEQAGPVGIVLFFISLSALFLSSLTLFMTWVYRRALGATSAAHHLGGAFRQALLLSLFLVTLVFFQMKQMLIWWDVLLLLALMLLIEFSSRHLFFRDEQN